MKLIFDVVFTRVCLYVILFSLQSFAILYTMYAPHPSCTHAITTTMWDSQDKGDLPILQINRGI